MRVLLAFDKFKDALTARQACEVAAGALRASHPDWQLDLCPLTDGGEGFCETLTRQLQGRLEQRDVSGPRGMTVSASTGFIRTENLSPTVQTRLNLSPGGNLAVIEMASASGLALLPPAERNPWKTTSRGTGELLGYAAHEKADAILLGIGGSATNDLGLGALAARGFKFLTKDGEAIEVPTPDQWERITRIEPATLKLPAIFIACDVTNLLLGPRGATATFGPQKGLKPEDFPRLEAQVARMAALLCDACGQPRSLAETPGTGAAGGLGFGLMAACGPATSFGSGAKLISGFDLVADCLDLPARLAAADLVLTGEGRFDATSLVGKGPGSVVAGARRLGKPVHVFAGSLGAPALSGVAGPADASFHALTPAGMPLAAALPRTAELLATAVARMV